ncbi:hypothetical protein E2C01_014098 [Portunus trituberculatus]|uniref:Uncharacterized protein n=1 Tax=Portunus trituberculatus TaxID=210409 RepID=A0A5B7DHX4_PORTR|nr:hypothetical protein [Portunus trituberculatus]
MHQHTSSHHPPPPSPLPHHNPPHHTQNRQRNKEEKASLITIQEALLQNIEKGNEDVENPAFDYSFKPDVYKNTITMHCTTSNFKNTSQPEKVRARRRKKSLFMTNIIDRRGLGA